MLVLAPWGIESTDIMGSVRAAFFGFQVGDVTISLSSIVIAALLFGLGFTVTRIIQRWLDNTFLPATELDAGLRNSIRTAFGYVGNITAGMIAFSYLGLSLERSDHRRRRPVGRYRFRPAIHRQQLHLRPDPALGAPDPRRRSRRRRATARAMSGASTSAPPKSRPSTARR